jgi:hypothetical protein
MSAFVELPELPALSDHPDPSPPLARPPKEALAALRATATLAAHKDPERHLFANCGPHELWTKEPDPAQEIAQAKAKLDRLEQADAAASALEGEVANAPAACGSQEETRALEVEVRDAAGPVRGVEVALYRPEPPGVLSANTDAQGLVRFEGLLPADAHQLWLPALAREAWTVETTASLPSERATCHHVAHWPAPSKAKAQPETHHVVELGECIWTLAHDHGYDHEALWSANAALQQQGRLPNELAPGDEVVLPAKDEPVRADASPGKRITIEVEAVLPRARLYFQDAEGKPRTNLGFVARVVTKDGTEQVWEGTTDGSGGFDESVPADAQTLDVVLKLEPEPEPYHFRFAHLDPLETISGIQGRLVNLGYDCGTERGELGPLTRRSLRDFQTEHDVESSGQIDDATRTKIKRSYAK